MKSMESGLKVAELRRPKDWTPCSFPRSVKNDRHPEALADHVPIHPGAAAKSPRCGSRVSPNASAKVSRDSFPRSCPKIPPPGSIKVGAPIFRAGARRIEAAAGER